MTFTYTWILHFLWVVPVIGFVLIVHIRQKRRALSRFADNELVNRLTGSERKGMEFLKSLLLLASIAFMIIALAGPRWGMHYQEVTQQGVDIIMAVDVSPSMKVEDVPPNRLERAKREVLDLLHVLQGDRIGLVAFSGAAFVQCPLTLDYGALEMFLSQLDVDLIPIPGTDLGAAIESSLSSFDYESKTDKVIILITDGEDNEGKGMEAARKAQDKGVKIFIFGIGEPSGKPIPSTDGGGFKKDTKGNIIVSRLEEDVLKNIASATGGRYVKAITGDLDLDVLYFEGIKMHTESTELKSGKIKVYEERFQIFVLMAFVLLLLEGLIVERRSVNT